MLVVISADTLSKGVAYALTSRSKHAPSVLSGLDFDFCRMQKSGCICPSTQSLFDHSETQETRYPERRSQALTSKMSFLCHVNL